MESQHDVVRRLVSLVSLVQIDNAAGTVQDYYESLSTVEKIKVHETLDALRRLLPPKPELHIRWKRRPT